MNEDVNEVEVPLPQEKTKQDCSSEYEYMFIRDQPQAGYDTKLVNSIRTKINKGNITKSAVPFKCENTNQITRENQQTPDTAQGQILKSKTPSLKSRLKQRLLLNAASPSLVQNNIEDLRKESLAKAKLEASQIRREGISDGIGPFYGLPSKVQEMLATNRKITKLYGKMSFSYLVLI